MRFGRSINQEISHRAQSRAKGVFHIVPEEQLKRTNIQLGANMRLVEFQLPSGLFVRHPSIGAAAQKLPAYNFRVPLQIDEKGEFVSDYLFDLVGSLKPGPNNASETMDTMMKIHGMLRRELVTAIKEASPYKPSARVLHSLQDVSPFTAIREESTSMSFGTSMGMLLPSEMFLPKEHSKLFLPSSGKLPEYLRSYAYVQTLENGQGQRQSRLYGSEILGAMAQNDADGDRATVLMTKLVDTANNLLSRWVHVPEWPGTHLTGPRMDPGKWYARRGKGLLEEELSLYRGLDFLGGQNPQRVAGLVWKSMRDRALKGSKEVIDVSIRKTLNELGSSIGQVTNAAEALQRAQALVILKAMDKKDADLIMGDKGLFTIFMANAQLLKTEGGPGGFRQLMESVIQAQKKGRGAADEILKSFSLGFRRDMMAFWSQKDLRNRSEGAMNEFLAHLMAGGDWNEGIHKLRTGAFIKGSDFESNRYKGLPPGQTRGWSEAEKIIDSKGRSATSVLRDVGLFDIQTIGRRVDQLPSAQLLRMIDPSTGELVPMFNQIKSLESGQEIHQGYLLLPGKSETDVFTGWQMFERELMSDTSFRSAITIKDKSIDQGYRLVGELTGYWSYPKLMSGDSLAVSKIRELARELGITEEQAWAEARKGPSSLEVLVRRLELIRGGRFKKIQKAVSKVLSDLQSKEVRYSEQEGRLVVTSGTEQYASRALLVDSGISEGIDAQSSNFSKLFFNSELASPYKASQGGRFVSTISTKGLDSSVNLSRYQVSLTQGLNSNWKTTNTALMQFDIEEFKERAWQMALFHHQESGVEIASEAEIKERVEKFWTGGSGSIKGLDLFGQESGFASADLVKNIRDSNKEVLSADELSEMLGITKQVSSVKKIASNYGPLQFYIRKKDGTIEEVDNLLPIENPAAKGTIPEVLQKVVEKNPTTQGRNALRRLQTLPSHQETPSSDTLNTYMETMQEVLEASTRQDDELWAKNVETGNEFKLFSGRIPTFRDEEGQVFNSTELMGGDLKPINAGNMWGVSHAGSVLDLVAEDTQQLNYAAEEISRLTGVPVKSLKDAITKKDIKFMNNVFAQTDSVHDLVTPELLSVVEGLRQVTGRLSPAETVAVRQRAEQEMLDGASQAIMKAGALHRFGAGVEKELLNSSVNFAEEVFGHSTAAGNLLKEIGENILKQFLS